MTTVIVHPVKQFLPNLYDGDKSEFKQRYRELVRRWNSLHNVIQVIPNLAYTTVVNRNNGTIVCDYFPYPYNGNFQILGMNSLKKLLIPTEVIEFGGLRFDCCVRLYAIEAAKRGYRVRMRLDLTDAVCHPNVISDRTYISLFKSLMKNGIEIFPKLDEETFYTVIYPGGSRKFPHFKNFDEAVKTLSRHYTAEELKYLGIELKEEKLFTCEL